MSEPTSRAGAAAIGRFLEIQNLGLNLPFALAFLVLASGGVPSLDKLVWIVIAFVAARNAGHSFNRWADRTLDARNPRTANRALVTGRISPRFALAFALANAGVLVVAAYLLSPLAFVLAPVAIALVFGYSYTKRYTSATTAVLGLVEAVTPAAIYIAVVGTLPPAVLLVVGGMLCWGTAFETIHSLGDLESDRAEGLRSIPVRFGVSVSLRLVVALHATALVLLAAFGGALHLAYPYYVALVAMAVVAAWGDWELARHPTATRPIFERHFLSSALYLAGVLVAIFAV
ncbi:MAG: 4-hydroxybenzoate octaprenyltransferase [Thermoplasmata archaeon]